MSWWDRVVAIFKREAADLKEGLGEAGKAIDAELARKERELVAEPHERVDMIVEDIEAADAGFEELEERIRRELPD